MMPILEDIPQEEESQQGVIMPANLTIDMHDAQRPIEELLNEPRQTRSRTTFNQVTPERICSGRSGKSKKNNRSAMRRKKRNKDLKVRFLDSINEKKNNRKKITKMYKQLDDKLTRVKES